MLILFRKYLIYDTSCMILIKAVIMSFHLWTIAVGVHLVTVFYKYNCKIA